MYDTEVAGCIDRPWSFGFVKLRSRVQVELESETVISTVGDVTSTDAGGR